MVCAEIKIDMVKLTLDGMVKSKSMWNCGVAAHVRPLPQLVSLEQKGWLFLWWLSCSFCRSNNLLGNAHPAFADTGSASCLL